MCAFPIIPLAKNPSEPDNDWVVDVSKSAYDEETKILKGSFSRRAMGSSMNDIAFRVDFAYEY